MAINKGWNGALYAGSTSADSELVYINNWELAFSGDALENTAFGDTVYDRGFQPGVRSHTLTFSGYSDPADNSHDYLLDLQKTTTANALVYVKAAYARSTKGSSQSSKAKGWEGKGVVTGLTIATPVDGLAAFSGTVQIAGGLTTATS